MHYKLLYPNEYLCAADLRGKDVTLTIARLVQEELRVERGTEAKWVIFFKEPEAKHKKNPKKHINKRLVANKTNLRSIAKVHGPETNDWIGKRITLFPTVCQAFGEQVDCIRVREKAPPSKQRQEPDPEPIDDDEPGFDPDELDHDAA